MLNITEIKKRYDIDGDRLYIYLQGCIHNCEYCHKPEMVKFIKKQIISVGDVCSLIELERSKIKGVVFYGGEPLMQSKELSRLAKLIKERTNLDIWCLTGYSKAQITQIQYEDTFRLLSNVDTLIVSNCDDNVECDDKLLERNEIIKIVEKKLNPVSDTLTVSNYNNIEK